MITKVRNTSTSSFIGDDISECDLWFLIVNLWSLIFQTPDGERESRAEPGGDRAEGEGGRDEGKDYLFLLVY